MKSIQYTIRSVPPKLDTKLKKNAVRRGVSLNRYVLEELSNSVGSSLSNVNNDTSFNKYIGKWGSQESKEFDKTLKNIRIIDAKIWN